MPSKIIQDEIFCRSKIQDAKIKVRKIEGEKSKMKKSPEKYVSRNGYQMKLVFAGPLETRVRVFEAPGGVFKCPRFFLGVLAGVYMR